MGEFGLGNILSAYASYELFGIYLGAGCGYLFFKDELNNTSINVIEPGLIFLKPINYFLLRIRVGRNYINEEMYGIRSQSTSITPDFLVKWKELYAGVSIPIVMGKEGKSASLSVGAGYLYSFNILTGGKGQDIYEKSGTKKEVEKRAWERLKPSGVSASDGTYFDKIEVTWNTLKQAEEYHIYRSKRPNGIFQEIDVSKSHSYSDFNVSTGANYYYKIRAYSSKFKDTDYSDYDVGFVVGIIPPSNVSASDCKFTNQVVVTWNIVNGAERYYIYRASATNDPFLEIGNITSNVYYDLGVEKGGKYYYKVKSYSSSQGYSGFSKYNAGGYYSTWKDFPSPTTNKFSSIYFISPTNGWACGGWLKEGDTHNNLGFILHNDGNSWVNVSIPTTEDIWDIQFLNPQNGWAVGDSGTILNYDGNSWNPITSPTTNDLMSIFMLSESNGWAFGGDSYYGAHSIPDSISTILHYDGINWSTMPSPTTNTIGDSYFISENDGWAITPLDILHFNGTNWTIYTNLPLASAYFNDSIFFISSDEGWLIRTAETATAPYLRTDIHKYDNGSWTFYGQYSMSLKKIFFISQNRGLTVGKGGVVQYKDGVWNIELGEECSGCWPFPTFHMLTAVFMNTPYEGWAGGSDGRIYRYHCHGED